tara:strand:- start:24 stop:1346 length:1323 start_codon:yes stop_codon:yes gene_type:complete
MNKYLILFIALLCSCAQPPQINPEWIVNEPNSDSNYWVGIGTIKKPLPDNYREIAQQRALNQIASQIKVEIKSEFSSLVQNLNYNLDEYFSSVINSRVNQEIDFVEYVDSYESKNDFSVYARLSIPNYLAEQERKLNIAKKASLEYLSQVEPFNVNSFNLLSLAFIEIQSYLDQNLDIIDPFSENRTINLPTLIKLKLFDFLDRVQIIPDSNPFEIKLFSNEKSYYTAKCIDKKTGERLEDIPIIYKINRNDKYKSVISSKDGLITIDPFNSISNDELEFITHGFDIKSLVDKSMIKLLKNNIRFYRIPFKIKPLNIYINSNESNLGVSINSPFISSSIKEYLSSNINCKFSNDNKYDYIIKVKVYSSSRSQNPDQYGFFFVYANAELTVVSTIDNKELYSKSIKQVKGGHIELKLAGMKALDNLQKEITAELPDLISIF